MSNFIVEETWEKDGRTLEPIKIQFEHGQLLGEEAIGTRDLSKFFTGHLYTGYAVNQHRKSTCLLSNPNLPSISKTKSKVVALESDSSMMYVGSTENDFNQQRIPIPISEDEPQLESRSELTPKIKKEPEIETPLRKVKKEPGIETPSKKIKKEPGTESTPQIIKLEPETDSIYKSNLKSRTESKNKTTSGSGVKTFILMKKKDSPFVKLFETTEITVSPYVAGRSYIEEQEKMTKKTLKDRQAASADLIREFGSKKKRLYMERIEKNQVTDMNDSIMSAASEARFDNLPEEDTSDNSILQLIPPCNREATVPSEVYSVNDLLSDNELQDLEDAAQKCLTCTEEDIKQWKKEKTFSDLLYSSLARLQKKPHNFLSMKLILYAEILIKLYKMRPHEFARAIPKFPAVFPQNLVQKAYDSFTTVNALYQRNRSDELKNKTCCYIMVLTLLANDFKFDIQVMSTIFQIHINKLLTLAKAVGITVWHNAPTKEYKAVLKLPLPKQIEKRGAKRRLRR